MRRSVILFAAVVAGMLGSGAVGAAVGASSVPTIKACVEKDGTMRYSATGACHTGEKKLTWNIAGVAGPKGATGATGPQGPAGGSGDSGPGPIAFYLNEGTGPVKVSVSPIASLRVPAGSFFVDVAVKAGETLGTAEGGCFLTTNPQGDDHSQGVLDTVGVFYSDKFPYSYGLHAAIVVQSLTTLYVACTAGAPVDADGHGTNGSASASAQIKATSAQQQPQP